MSNNKREHYEKYETIAQTLGIESVQRLVPARKDELEHALVTGEGYLNEIPLQRWDACDNSMRVLCRLAGVSVWSLCDTVCTLKHVAKYHIVGIEPPPVIKGDA